MTLSLRSSVLIGTAGLTSVFASAAAAQTPSHIRISAGVAFNSEVAYPTPAGSTASADPIVRTISVFCQGDSLDPDAYVIVHIRHLSAPGEFVTLPVLVAGRDGKSASPMAYFVANAATYFPLPPHSATSPNDFVVRAEANAGATGRCDVSLIGDFVSQP